MSSHDLRVRDYKHPGRGGLAVDARRRDAGRGVIVGVTVTAALLMAALLLLRARRAERPLAPRQAAIQAESPGRVLARGGALSGSAAVSARSASAAAGTGDAASVGKYDFYQMLPRFEVVVPEREHDSRPAPTAQIDQPGSYFLQVGSYRDVAVAERIRAQIAKLGIDATVQRVAVNSDVWHRVRVGPIRDLAVLNRLRRELQSFDLDSLVIRVED